MTQQATQQRVDTATLANDFAARMQGKMEPEQIQAAVEKLKSSANTASYSANGSVASLIFYLKFQVTVKGGKTFNGNAGGISTPGGGALMGDVYTDDINRLYSDTCSFEFQATPVYTSLLFFDSHSNLLGHFQAGAVSIVTGVGGGSGSWS
jgi:hypothetical protein